MSYEVKPRPPELLIARRGYNDQGSLGGIEDILSSIGSAVKSVGTGALSVIGGKSQSEGEAAAYAELAKQQAAANQQSAMPSWVLPAAAVGAGVLLIVLLKRRK
jgi:hypothetical protein